MYKQFTKNDIKTVLKPMKQCPSSLKINNTEIPFLTYLTGKEYDNIFCCQGCGEMEIHILLVGMHTSIIFLERNLAESNKAIYALSLFDPAIQQFDF